MLSETEMLNRISSHREMTRTANRAFLRESAGAERRRPMRRLVLAWGWLVAKA